MPVWQGVSSDEAIDYAIQNQIILVYCQIERVPTHQRFLDTKDSQALHTFQAGNLNIIDTALFGGIHQP